MRRCNPQPKLAAVRRLPGVALLLAAAAAAVYASPALTTLLQYDRVAIASGQLWRLVTCHWTHWSVDHLLWDAVAFAFLAVLCERDGRRRLVVCLLVAAPVISIGLWWLEPQMLTYRGLSGVDSALFAMLAATIAREQIASRNWRWVAAVALVCAGFGAKVWYETATGATFFCDSVAGDFAPIPMAHVIGAVLGLLFAAAPRNGAQRRHSSTDDESHAATPCASSSAKRAARSPSLSCDRAH